MGGERHLLTLSLFKKVGGFETFIILVPTKINLKSSSFFFNQILVRGKFTHQHLCHAPWQVETFGPSSWQTGLAFFEM